MDLRTASRLAAVALSASLVAALTLPGSATAASESTADAGGSSDMLSVAPPEMLVAMQRDLDLSPTEAVERLANDEEAGHTERKLRQQLAGHFGGAWLTDDQRLIVAVTDVRQARQIHATGARPWVVSHSENDLDSTKSALDEIDSPPADAVSGWYVDVTTNTVVVQAQPSEIETAVEFVDASGVDPAMVRIEESTDAPELYYDIRGGDAYYPGSSRCSIGFAVTRGFVTAGHCGSAGTSTRGHNQVAQGVIRGSVFPGSDMAWVETNSSWTSQPWVNRYSGNIVVNGSQEASIGAAVCRSGSTTGYRCGTITAKNQTVNYSQGSVRGLTRTSACAEPGDSGGSFIASGINAQGVTSGGSGNCTFGGTTFFQPVNPILSRYNLTLVTG